MAVTVSSVVCVMRGSSVILRLDSVITVTSIMQERYVPRPRGIGKGVIKDHSAIAFYISFKTIDVS